MSTTYRVTFETNATVTVDVEVPDEIEEFEADDWAADKAHEIAEEDIATWGIGLRGRARLDMSLDGIGADTAEKVED